MIIRQIIANFILFLIGNIGLINISRSIILILMCLEIIILSGSFNFIIFGVYLDDIYGQIVGILALTIAAAESGIALAIIIFYNRQKQYVDLYV
jgi:NADH:ubiquinone oxidoreductase subunit K